MFHIDSCSHNGRAQINQFGNPWSKSEHNYNRPHASVIGWCWLPGLPSRRVLCTLVDIRVSHCLDQHKFITTCCCSGSVLFLQGCSSTGTYLHLIKVTYFIHDVLYCIYTKYPPLFTEMGECINLTKYIFVNCSVKRKRHRARQHVMNGYKLYHILNWIQ